MPFVLGYPLLKATIISAGVALTNNRDFDDFDFRANYNVRTSLLIKGSYTLKERLDLVLLFKKNLSNIPDVYLVNQPDNDILLGVSYKLF